MLSENSLSSLLSSLLVLNNNSIESFSKVNEAITTDEETVTLNIEQPDGSLQTFTIPSFNYLKQSIERLNNNLNAISNLSHNGSTVRLSDGTYRKLITQKLPSEASTITQLPTINSFKIKSNYFFENMMNPLLCVTLDLTNQVNADADRVIVKRYLLDTDNSYKVDLFDKTFKNNSTIDYSDFLHTLVDNKISYVLDEETVNLQPTTNRYSGEFDVIKITNDKITETINGSETTRTRKLVKLNTLLYTDTMSGYVNTMQLAVGDMLVVNEEPVDTKYVIKQIDTSTNTVVLELVEGYRSVKIGSSYFKISSEKVNRVSIDVTVGFNERCVVFIKPVDRNSNLAASNWSPGVGFFTNDLTFSDSNGQLLTLQQYYQRSVIDFGSFLLSYANDWYPSSSEGVTPDAPILETANFTVTQINKQLTTAEDITKVKELNAQKANLKAQITAKSSAISDLKSKINSTNYVSSAMRAKDVAQLQDMVKDYDSLTSTYSSVVSTISSLSQSSSLASITPKYRVRGFWEMPQEKSTPATGPQAIIKFKIRYRYLSKDGAANAVEQIGDTTVGSFSNYNIVESKLRGRKKNEKTGEFYWEEINLNNSDEININQLDIPITKNEQVEIQVKSISEAGFPSNPLESDWSEPIMIDFPEEFSTNSVVDDILKANSADESQMIVDQTLNSKGLLNHIADSFMANESTFAHTANNIASGFVSEEQTPISLYQKIADMQATINQLLDIIGDSMGVMVVTLSDEDGNVYEVKKDSLTRIYAGAYMSEASKLTDPKGAIITKNFNINIQNTAQTGLRLVSRLIGSRTGMVKESSAYTDHENYPNKGTYDDQDTVYNTYERYDLVPINCYNEEIELIDGVVHNVNNYQSAQCKNQFINIRFKDISGERSYYAEDGDFNLNEHHLDSISGGDVTIGDSYAWCYKFNDDGTPKQVEDGKTSTNNFLVSVKHPYLANKNTWIDAINQLFNTEISGEVANDWEEVAGFVYRLSKNQILESNAIQNSITLNLPNNNIYTQSPYEYVQKTLPSELGEVTRNFTHKIGYEPYDQYFIGNNTCTSYLFLNPGTHKDIQVDGDARTSSKVITGNSLISIPLTFQYRMTDYYGDDTNTTGNILGDKKLGTDYNSLANISMANRVGIDIWNNKDEATSFDVEIYATYGETSVNITPDTLVQFNANTMASAINNSKTRRSTPTPVQSKIRR